VATCLADLVGSGGLEEHIKTTLIPAYARRQAALDKAIKTYLVPLGVHQAEMASTSSSGPVGGGYFTWLYLPEPMKASALAERAMAEEQLVIAAGDLFKVADDESEQNTFGEAVRLCFAWEEEESLVEGVQRLARVIRKTKESGEDYKGVGMLDLSRFR
jgi:DNA-binding transcriptional MocR family regulator